MTELEWLNAQELAPLYEHLTKDGVRLSRRKLRLACTAMARSSAWWDEHKENFKHWQYGETDRPPEEGDPHLTMELWADLLEEDEETGPIEGDATASVLASVFREIFGNPFQIIKPLSISVLEWNDGVVRKLAQQIYDNENFELLPILADALEEAGYTDGYLIRHLRGQRPCPVNYGNGFHRSPSYVSKKWFCDVCMGTEWVPLDISHFRGCWAIDHVLGKQKE